MIAFVKNIKITDDINEKYEMIDNMEIKLTWNKMQLANPMSHYSINELFKYYDKWNNYYIFGQNNWKIPTHTELVKSKLMNGDFTLFRYKNINKKKLKDIGYKPTCKNSNCYGYSYRIDNKGYNYARQDAKLYLTRKYNQYDKIIYSKVSASKKLSQLTTLLTQEKLKVAKDKVKKPTKLKQQKPKKLKKGEFEKTVDYSVRVKKNKKE